MIKILLLMLFGFAAGAAAGSEEPLSVALHSVPWYGDLDALAAHRAIRVLVPYSKTLYFVDFGGTQRGLSYDFMRAFEDFLNARMGRGDLRIHAVFIAVSRDKLLPMLIAGQGDVVAANLTVTPARAAQVDFVSPVATGVREIVVTGPGADALRTLEDLSGKEVYVQRASSYFDSLGTLNETFRNRHLAPMKLRFAPGNFEAEDVLEMLNAGLVKIAVADDYLARFWRAIYPNLSLRDDLVVGAQRDLAFAVRKDSPKLKALLDEFTLSHRVGTLFGNVELRKYLHETRWAKDAVSAAELQKFNTLVSLFQKYGRQYDIDWLLMAAQGYQESQLDQSRRSAAGAVGIMQLTADTAKQMDVGDINELEPNIHAGIKYVRFMVDTYYAQDKLDPLNKVLFAFASYNAGPNRIYIAYTLVEEDVARTLEHTGEPPRAP